MSKRLSLFLWSALAGMLSAVLAGLIGRVWGVPCDDPLTPAFYSAALLSGAFIGIVPTLMIAGLNVRFCSDASSRFAAILAPILTAGVIFPLVYFLTVIVEEWSRAGCN